MNSAALVFALAALVSTAVAAAYPPEANRVKRLTTFSKPPEPNQPTIGTRECKMQEDCTIRGTSCTVDKRDSRRRCICDDGNPPSNGQCPNRKRMRRGYIPSVNPHPYTGLREKCNRDDECIPQASCVLNTTVHRTLKVCLCDTDFEEVDNACGGCGKIIETGSLILLISFAAYVLDGRH